MTDDTPTLGEVVRRLDDVSRRLDDVSSRLDQRETRMAAEYVRRDVFEATQQTDGVQMRGLESEHHNLKKRLDRAEDQRRQDRALVLSSLAFPLLVLILGALLITQGV